MKKYSVKIASLALLFATGAALGMEKETETLTREKSAAKKVYVRSHLTPGKTGEYQIGAEITTTKGPREVKIDKEGETKLLGDLSSIETLKMRRPGFGSGQSAGLGLRSADDLTDRIQQAKKEASNNPKKALLITVEWAGGMSYSWKYTFSWVDFVTLSENTETMGSGMSQLLINYFKNFNEHFTNVVGQIWIGDVTPQKLFRKKLEEYTRLYADGTISAQSYGENIEFLLSKLNDFNNSKK